MGNKDTIGHWKEYFKNRLCPTDTPSVEEARSVNEKDELPITEFTEVVNKLGWMRFTLSSLNLWMLWGCPG